MPSPLPAPAVCALRKAAAAPNGVVPRGEHAPLPLLESLAQAGHLSLVFQYTGKRQTVIGGYISDAGRAVVETVDAGGGR